jgi:hypothetical protein
MLSCIVMAGSIFLTVEDHAIRFDTISHIKRESNVRIGITFSDKQTYETFNLKALEDDRSINPAQLVVEAIAPCQNKVSTQ